jgi:hypothetical protein
VPMPGLRWRGFGPTAVIVGVLLVAACGGDDSGDDGGSATPTAPSADASGTVDASAEFSLTYQGETQEYAYSQSAVIGSTLTGTPQVPVSLHATDPDEFLDEFVLAGQVDEGEQETSDALAVGVGVHIGDSVVSLNSTEGDCTVDVESISESEIAGTFHCEVDYAGEPVTADGTFAAS